MSADTPPGSPIQPSSPEMGTGSGSSSSGGGGGGGGGGSGRGADGDANQQQVPYPLLSSKDDKALRPSVEGQGASTTAEAAAAGTGEAAAAAAVAAAAVAAGGVGAGARTAGERKARPGALLAAQNAAYSAKAAAAETRGFIGDQDKRDRFNEFISGFLSMSLFQAADVWLPLAGGVGGGGTGGGGNGGVGGRNGGGGGGGGGGGAGGGGTGGGGTGGDSSNGKISRLFLFSSNVQDARLEKWSTLSRNVVLASGVGLPGLVFQERRPQWAVDYSQVDADRNPLASVARLLGIGSAFGVPLSLGSHECGVVMLYSMSCLPPSELMVEFMERATRMLLADAPAPTVLRQQFAQNPPSAKTIGRVAGAYRQHAIWAEHQQKSQNNSSNTTTTTTNTTTTETTTTATTNITNTNTNANSNKRRMLSHSPFPDGGGGSTGGSSGGSGSGSGGSGGGSSSSPSSPEDGTPAEGVAEEEGGWGGNDAALAVAAVAAASGGQGGGFRADGGAVAFLPPRDWPDNGTPVPPLLFNRVDLDGRPSGTEAKPSTPPPLTPGVSLSYFPSPCPPPPSILCSPDLT
ncbi:unnamed protein product [Laminaria digitata]